MGVLLNVLFLFLYFTFFIFFEKSLRRFFGKYSKFEAKSGRFMELKKIRVKTVDEQREYIKLQSSLGHNIFTNIFINLAFVLSYMFLIYDKIPNFLAGLASAIIFAPLIAYAACQMYGKEYRTMFYFSFVNGFIFITIFLNFIRFFEVVNLWFIIIGLILFSIIIEKLYDKIVGG